MITSAKLRGRFKHLMLLTALALPACSGDSPTDPQADTTPATIEIIGLPTEINSLNAGTQLQAEVKNSAGLSLSSSGVQWSSSDPSVIEISGTGSMTARQDGSAVVSATTSNGVTASGTVVVNQIAVRLEKVMGDQQVGYIGRDLEQILAVRALDEGGSPVFKGQFYYTLARGLGVVSSASAEGLPPGSVAVAYRPTSISGQHQIVLEYESLSTTFYIDVGYPPVVIATDSLPPAVVDESYSFEFAVSGGNDLTYSWSLTSGSLPPGLTLGLGRLVGWPTAAGTYSFELTAQSAGEQASKDFTLEVFPKLAILEQTLPPLLTDRNYDIQLEATGGSSAKSWTASGLPLGLSLSDTGRLTGQPSQRGVFSVSFTVASGSASDTWRTSLNIYNPLVITTPSTLPQGTRGRYYSTYISTSGGNGRGYDDDLEIVAGALPPGLTFSDVTGNIYGTPSAIGTYLFTVRYIDNDQIYVDKDFSLRIVP